MRRCWKAGREGFELSNRSRCVKFSPFPFRRSRPMPEQPATVRICLRNSWIHTPSSPPPIAALRRACKMYVFVISGFRLFDSSIRLPPRTSHPQPPNSNAGIQRVIFPLPHSIRGHTAIQDQASTHSFIRRHSTCHPARLIPPNSFSSRTSSNAASHMDRRHLHFPSRGNTSMLLSPLFERHDQYVSRSFFCFSCMIADVYLFSRLLLLIFGLEGTETWTVESTRLISGMLYVIFATLHN